MIDENKTLSEIYNNESAYTQNDIKDMLCHATLILNCLINRCLLFIFENSFGVKL